MPARAFTVSEANALIPHLENVLREMGRARDAVLEHRGKLGILETLWGAEVHQRGNPDHPEWRDRHREAEELVRRIELLVQEGILAQGVRIPAGGLEHGLVDFPTTWNGRWVFLCWRLGEPQIHHWHEVDAGFAGREPLTPEQARLMGRHDDPGLLEAFPGGI
jgi:hypothetical protein